jgi:hypothetical protein
MPEHRYSIGARPSLCLRSDNEPLQYPKVAVQEIAAGTAEQARNAQPDHARHRENPDNAIV